MSADEATGTPERAGTGTPIDDLAAVADEAGPAATHVAWKPVAIGIAATLAAVAWNRIGRVRAERAEQAALETARSDCARASKSLRAAMDAYEALKAGKAADTAKTTAKQVEDARTVAALDKALNAKEPKAVACTADTRAGYERQTSRVDANRDWYKEHKASLAKAVEAVGESRDAKTITDAKKLLNDSKGKVQDERTRDALDKAIKAKDTQAITKAVKAVDDSVKAKERKDAEAKAKAEAEAKEKAREQAQARQDGGSSGSVPPNQATPRQADPRAGTPPPVRQAPTVRRRRRHRPRPRSPRRAGTFRRREARTDCPTGTRACDGTGIPEYRDTDKPTYRNTGIGMSCCRAKAVARCAPSAFACLGRDRSPWERGR